jgi:hypothetical protein
LLYISHKYRTTIVSPSLIECSFHLLFYKQFSYAPTLLFGTDEEKYRGVQESKGDLLQPKQDSYH